MCNLFNIIIMKKYIIPLVIVVMLLLIAAGCRLGWLLGSKKKDPNAADTVQVQVWRIDTVRVPTLLTVHAVKKDTFFLPVEVVKIDTLTDSVEVVLDRSQKVYSDSVEGCNYTAYVSGVAPALDSIQISHLRTQVIKNKPAKWWVSVSGGVGIGGGGITPFVGVGISYNILKIK